MWGIFVGFALGVFQVLVLRRSVEMMTASKTNIALGVMISVGKLALILLVLYLMARFAGVRSVLWCAGGLAVGMVGVPLVQHARAMKKFKRQDGENEG